MSCDKPILTPDGYSEVPGAHCSLATDHPGVCIDGDTEANPYVDTTIELDKFYGELDAATAVSFHVAGYRAQSYSGAGAGVFDSYGDERDFEPGSTSASAELFAKLNSPRHMRAVEALERCYQTVIRVPWELRQTLALAFTPRRWRGEADPAASPDAEAAPPGMPVHTFQDMRRSRHPEVARPRPEPKRPCKCTVSSLCATHASYAATYDVAQQWLTFGKLPARVRLLALSVSLGDSQSGSYERLIRAAERLRRRQDLVRQKKILLEAKFDAWQRLQPALAAYEAIRAPREMIERRMRRDDTAKRRAEARYAELQSGSKLRIRAPAPPPVFTPQEVIELHEMVRRLAETGAPDA